MWRRGRPCADGNCVEVAVTSGEVLVRSSVNPGLLISLSRDEWLEFLSSAKEGWFDHVQLSPAEGLYLSLVSFMATSRCEGDSGGSVASSAWLARSMVETMSPLRADARAA